MKRFTCWLIGHSIDPMLASGWYPCCRCDHVFDEEPRTDLWFYLTWYRWFPSYRWLVVRHWLKCPDCGSRFGSHRDDCMPF